MVPNSWAINVVKVSNTYPNKPANKGAQSLFTPNFFYSKLSVPFCLPYNYLMYSLILVGVSNHVMWVGGLTLPWGQLLGRGREIGFLDLTSLSSGGRCQMYLPSCAAWQKMVWRKSGGVDVGHMNVFAQQLSKVCGHLKGDVHLCTKILFAFKMQN